MSDPASVPSKPAAPKLVRFAAPLLLLLAVGTLAAAFLLPLPRRAVPVTSAGDAPLSEVPAFALTERSGKTLTAADLRGKVWVASFVFTRCTGPCPSVTGTVAKLQSELDLANQPDLRLVTFTVDPGRDGPAELAKYAANFRADPEKWLFLTGTEPEIHSLLHDGFKIAAARSANPHPPEGQEFDHSTFLVVVDKTGKIRGYFDGYQGEHDPTGERFRDAQTRLAETVRGLLKE